MAVASEVETELKYEAGGAPPALRDLPGVSEVEGPGTERLSAVYFDTADLRLARHGATLRRRTGGGDAGWHLKVPVGGDSRVELRLPLDAGPATNAPPAELAELTFGMARGVSIRPIALVKTKREVWRLLDDAGQLVAEVADDRVTARRLDDESSTADKWRELEVELARILPAVTAPPSGDTAGDALLAYLRAQFDEIVKQDLRVRRDEPDAVHQMRVAARRMRSVLRVYRKLLPGTSRLQSELRWLGRRLAGSRDLEVQQEHFQSAVSSLPVELAVGPVSARLDRHFAPALASARADVLATLGDKRYRRLLDSVDQLLADPELASRASRSASSELPRQLRQAYRRTKRRLSSDTLHRTRKAAKQYRYALEVAEPAVGRRARQARKQVRTLTKVLGEHQDSAVARPVLRDLGMRAHLAGENGFTFGLLYERERARGEEVERVYPTYWKRVRKTRLS